MLEQEAGYGMSACVVRKGMQVGVVRNGRQEEVVRNGSDADTERTRPKTLRVGKAGEAVGVENKRKEEGLGEWVDR